MLPYQLHSAPRVNWAIVPVHVIRCARDYLSLAITVVVAAIFIMVTITITIAVAVPISSVSFDREISPAAMVYPDASVIRAPTVAFPASRFATLLY